MRLTAEQARRQLREALAPVAGEDAAFEAGLMLAHVLGVAPGALLARREDELDPVARARLDEMLNRRLGREPLQYILGEWAFMGLPVRVRPGALIPRPDTEILAEQALRLAKARGYRTALDLCCGTGCIGIALAKLGGLAVTAADVDPGCAALTKENAALNGAAVAAVESDWFSGISGKFDMIVSNPPYLTRGDMENLQPELRFEPPLALDGGEDGLYAYRRIANRYRDHLNPGGALLMEVGMGQANDVLHLFGGEGEIFPDLAGIDRVVCIRPF